MQRPEVVSPVIAQNDPSGHAAHEVDPIESWYVPARQLEQLVEADVDVYEPEKQLEQTLADETEYEPAAQAPVTALRPVVAQ